MKHWHSLAVALTVFAAFSASAQTASERRVLINQQQEVELDNLRMRFQAEADEQEQRIAAYLKANPGALRTFTKDGSVFFLRRIDPEGNPVYINTKSNGLKNRASGQLIKADSLYSGGSIGVNITGAGMVAGIWDAGAVRESHELLQGSVANQPAQITVADNHMTHVSGTMVGKDIVNQPSARGIAFTATAKNWDFKADTAEMTPFAAAGGLISNHSYGLANDNTTPTWQFGAYDAEAAAWDEITKNAPSYLPFVAGGNEQQTSGNRAAKLGYDIMTGSSAAKNVMTVGAVNGGKSMSDYSNWGPTDDGRVKPDIVAKGTGINSAQATSDTAYSGNGADSSGTSYASPAAAAAGLLLQQYYNSLHGSYMKASTLKAVMLGTAEDLGRPGPDHQFGWGLLNVENAAFAIKKRSVTVPPGANSGLYPVATTRGAVIDEITANPTNDSTNEISRQVKAKGGVPLVVNIAWTDDAGTVQTAADGVDPTASRLVYEFDILVRSSTNVETRTWKIPSMANRTANATISTAWFDGNGANFKQVIIATPVAEDVYTIVFRKKSGSPAAARTISLVVTGLVETAVANGSCGSTIGIPTIPPTLDVDASGAPTKYDALTDGLLLIRHLFGITGPALTAGAVGNSATRTDPVAIKTYLDGIRPALDIDGDGKTTALTDGLLVLRYLFGLRGPTLIAGAVDPAGVRKTATEIETCIQSLMP